MSAAVAATFSESTPSRIGIVSRTSALGDCRVRQPRAFVAEQHEQRRAEVGFMNRRSAARHGGGDRQAAAVSLP